MDLQLCENLTNLSSTNYYKVIMLKEVKKCKNIKERTKYLITINMPLRFKVKRFKKFRKKRKNRRKKAFQVGYWLFHSPKRVKNFLERYFHPKFTIFGQKSGFRAKNHIKRD